MTEVPGLLIMYMESFFMTINTRPKGILKLKALKVFSLETGAETDI